MNDFTFDKTGWTHYTWWQKEDRKTLDKINKLVEDIRRNGALKGIGKPEKLKARDAYSRRIDDKNRLVYQINELGDIKIISCKGHYDE